MKKNVKWNVAEPPKKSKRKKQLNRCRALSIKVDEKLGNGEAFTKAIDGLDRRRTIHTMHQPSPSLSLEQAYETRFNPHQGFNTARRFSTGSVESLSEHLIRPHPPRKSRLSLGKLQNELIAVLKNLESIASNTKDVLEKVERSMNDASERKQDARGSGSTTSLDERVHEEFREKGSTEEHSVSTTGSDFSERADKHSCDFSVVLPPIDEEGKLPSNYLEVANSFEKFTPVEEASLTHDSILRPSAASRTSIVPDRASLSHTDRKERKKRLNRQATVTFQANTADAQRKSIKQSMYKGQLRLRDKKSLTFANVVQMMRQGRLLRITAEDCDESRIIDLYGERSYISFTTPPRWYILLPIAIGRIYWDIFIAILLFYYAIMIPLMIGFPVTNPPFWIESCFTVFFLVDIVLQFITAFEVRSGPSKGWMETRLSKIAGKYLTSWFIVDFAASVPFDLLFSAGDEYTSLRLLKLIRLLRVARLGRIMDRITSFLRAHPSLVRLLELLVSLGLLLHWMGCFYWFICNLEDFSTDWSPDFEMSEESGHFQYATALLWAIWVSTGTGMVFAPATGLEASYTIVATICGFLMYAFIIGSASTALQEMDIEKSWKSRRINQIKQYLKQRAVPDDFVNEIISYYEYRWCRNLDNQDDVDIFKGLHTTLKRSLQLAVNSQLVAKVPMFRDITETCLENLIKSLEARIYLPGEWVLMKGERGQEMYFIARGKFEVLPDISKKAIAVLTDGQSFGELALLTRRRRNSSVKSVCHGELMCLHIVDFEELLIEFPIFAVSLEKWAPHVRLSTGWAKIRHAVHLCGRLRDLGLKQSFSSMMTDINTLGNGFKHQKKKLFNSARRQSTANVLNPSIVAVQPGIMKPQLLSSGSRRNLKDFYNDNNC